MCGQGWALEPDTPLRFPHIWDTFVRDTFATSIWAWPRIRAESTLQLLVSNWRVLQAQTQGPNWRSGVSIIWGLWHGACAVEHPSSTLSLVSLLSEGLVPGGPFCHSKAPSGIRDTPPVGWRQWWPCPPPQKCQASSCWGVIGGTAVPVIAGSCYGVFSFTDKKCPDYTCPSEYWGVDGALSGWGCWVRRSGGRRE